MSWLTKLALAMPLLVVVASAAAGAHETTNFVISAPNAQVARQAGEFAERYRKQKALEWLGREMPPWGQKCPLEIKLTPGGRGTSGGGATTFAFDRGAILEQRMQVEGDLEQVLHSVLPHEITHTVFAYHFRDKVPRWADEGGSVLSENDFERSRHDDLVRRSLAGGRAFRLRYLFDLENYPRDGQDVMTLYAQGYAVVRYLVEQKGKPAFLNFVADAKRFGWDQALRNHYQIQSVEQLEQIWLEWMKRGMRSANVVASNPSREVPETREQESLPASRTTANPVNVAPKDVPSGRNAATVGLGTPAGAKVLPSKPKPPLPGPGSQGWSPLGSPEQAQASPARLGTPRTEDLPP